MTQVSNPFLIASVRSYLYDKELLKLARAADEVTEDTGLPIYFTYSYVDFRPLEEHTKNLITTAQSIDSLYPGRGMGYVLPDVLKAAGISVVFLNRTGNPKTVDDLYAAIKWAEELGMAAIMCVDSTVEAKILACMGPDILLAELVDLIDTGTTADDSYVVETVEGIGRVNPHVLVMIGSGISTADDCHNVIRLRTDGTGTTSSILKAPSPEFRVREMAEAIVRAQQERKEW